jgi:hypothetical protein
MIELVDGKTNQRAYVSKIKVDGEEVEYSDKWIIVTPYRSYSELEFTLLTYVQDKENKIGELQERVYAIENKLKELESDKRKK